MRTLPELLDNYRAAVAQGATSRELARLEAELREAAPPHIPRHPGSRVIRWQADTLGMSQHVLAARRDLWHAREPAELLWERVDASMPLGTATRLLRQARKLVATKHDREGLRLAIQRELGAFDGPHQLDPEPVEDGTSSRIDLPAADQAPRQFLIRLRRAVLEHVRPRLLTLPELERERLLDDFERDLSALMSQHNQKWQKISLALQENARVSRQRFVAALRVLHMDPPRRHAPLPPLLAQAKKQKRTLARLYHPDSHGGSDHTVAQYHAVLTAFLVVEQYVSENTSAETQPSLRVIRGGKQ